MFFFCQRLIPCSLVLCKMFCSLSSLHLEVITCPLSHLMSSILHHVLCLFFVLHLTSFSLSNLCPLSYIPFSVLHPFLCLTSCSLSSMMYSALSIYCLHSILWSSELNLFVKALQLHSNTQSHWSSRSTVCIPPSGTAVRVLGTHPHLQ
jgi:hypothetical protein